MALAHSRDGFPESVNRSSMNAADEPVVGRIACGGQHRNETRIQRDESGDEQGGSGTARSDARQAT